MAGIIRAREVYCLRATNSVRNILYTYTRPLRSASVGILCLILAIFVLQGCASKDADAGGGGGGGKGGGKGKGKGGGGGGPVPVVVTSVTQRDVPIEISVVGNVEAYSTIAVKAQVGGQLTQVYFTEGDFVKKDDKLFEIDPRQLVAQLAQAEANLSRDQALLGQAQANLARDTANEVYARGQADRYSQLATQGIISREQGDQLRSNADALGQGMVADRAAIESAKAQIEADKANRDNVKVQLGYTAITSPVDGRTGNLAVKQGNVVTANSDSLITINQVQPIYVTFAVPEARLTDIKEYMARGKLQVDAAPQDGSGQPERGELTFVDNNVDVTTGTIKLKGTFTNVNRQLWPGQFVNVTLRLTTRPNSLVVPNQVVQTGQDGQFVYVVKNDNTAEMRPVTVGPRVDQDMVIEKGLSLGESVVVDGQLRLAPGSRVQARGSGDGGGGGGRNGFRNKGGDADSGGGPGPDGQKGGGKGGFRKGKGKGGDGAPGDQETSGEGRGKRPQT
jgi:multidrug efflux system membrane fusion protein